MWNKKVKLSQFWTGLGMQLLQAGIVIVWVFSNLDWSWFKIQYLTKFVGGVVWIGYNIVSWKLLLRGLKEQ